MVCHAGHDKENHMKRLISVLMLLAMSLTIVGCEASGKVTDDDSNDGVHGRVQVGD
jgi:hypothetical protein